MSQLSLCLRWRARRSSFRPAGETIQPREYEVAALEKAEAEAFVTAHHYSKSWPSDRFRFGLFRRGQLVGAAVFSTPTRDEVTTHVFGGHRKESCDLGRFVLLDEVPANGESWFLARCLERLRRQKLEIDGKETTLRGFVSFSDPHPRRAADGRLIFPGHYGTIYQASNATFLGRATPRTLRILPDGTVFSERGISKIRAQLGYLRDVAQGRTFTAAELSKLRKKTRGWQARVEEMESYGAPPFDGDPSWLRRALGAVTRPERHPGNFKYAFGLWRPVRRALPPSLPYPKKEAA